VRLKSRFRRGHAAARPKLKRQNLQKFLAAVAVVLLAGCAVAAAFHFGRQLLAMKKTAVAATAGSAAPRSYPKEIAARVTQDGKPAGFLSLNGRLFQAPPSLYPGAVPQIEIGKAGQTDLAGAAKFLAEAARAQGGFSPLVRLSYVSPQDGWKAFFADGTEAEWGDFRWTDLKLERMRQVLNDAKDDLSGPANVDLRYFGDGRIILRAASAKSVSMR